MTFCVCGGRRIAAALYLSFAWVAAASAQELAWQVPVYAEVPSATGLGGQALGLSGNGEATLIIGAAWAGPADWSVDTEHPRFLAIDPSSGQRFWQRDLVGPCATQRDGIELVALFANGDAAVATIAYDNANNRRFACYARLDAKGGTHADRMRALKLSGADRHRGPQRRRFSSSTGRPVTISTRTAFTD